MLGGLWMDLSRVVTVIVGFVMGAVSLNLYLSLVVVKQ